MEEEIDPKLVLKYLNDMGYYNVSALQLTTFIKDLKRLIRDDRKKNSNRLNENEFNYENFMEQNKECVCNNISETINNVDVEQNDKNSIIIEDELDNISHIHINDNSCIPVLKNGDEALISIKIPIIDISSRDGSVKSRNSNKSENQTNLYEESFNSNTKNNLSKDKTSNDSLHESKSSEETISKIEENSNKTETIKTSSQKYSSSQKSYSNFSSKSKSKNYTTSNNSLDEISSLSKNEIKCSKPVSNISKETKSKSFIRPILTQGLKKSDPVQLYHDYQKQWKKFTIPGSNSYNSLRWNIREKMLGASTAREVPRHTISSRPVNK